MKITDVFQNVLLEIAVGTLMWKTLLFVDHFPKETFWVFQMLSLQNLGDVYPSWYVALINMETAHPFTDGMFPPVILCRWYMFIHTYTHTYLHMRFSKEDTQSPWLIIIFLIRRTICGFRAFLDTPISYHMGCHTAGLCGGPPSKGSQSCCGCSAGFDQRWT